MIEREREREREQASRPASQTSQDYLSECQPTGKEVQLLVWGKSLPRSNLMHNSIS